MSKKRRLPALWDGTKRRVAAQVDSLKASTGAALKQKATEIRNAIGPEKAEPRKEPERPFGKEEGGQDVKRVVWTGHKIANTQAHTYYGAVGLTHDGYYRAAEVQTYGAEEQWRWQPERYADKKDAVDRAAGQIADRFQGEKHMAENKMPIVLGDKDKAMVQDIGRKLSSFPMQAEKQSPPIDTYGDQGKALERAREQTRQTDRLPANHDHKQPDKG
jgi:hypothetical protein